MKNFDASDAECRFVLCAVCENGITGGKWFARVRHGERMVALCCPLCTETFEANPHAYVHRIETYAAFREHSG
jgi:uncharacterized CHY-type Zn-finger protein